MSRTWEVCLARPPLFLIDIDKGADELIGI